MPALIEHPALEEYGRRVAALSMRHLCVSLRTATPISTDRALHLDGLLAQAVVSYALEDNNLPSSNTPYHIPLPLKIHERHDGLPLWRSTDFVPVGARASMETHYHKRAETTYYMPAMIEADAQNLRRRMPSHSEGQHMDYRLPETLHYTHEWKAWCEGDQKEIETLLSGIVHVGRGCARGHGLVLDWRIEEADGEFSFYRGGLPLRPIPAQFGAVIGWTPPYWLPSAWRQCTPSLAWITEL